MKEKFPEVEWNRIRGLRNRIVHEYFGLITK
ncbi:MAG: HepT-like ribonuclease domain-containing protein [Cyclonatronaceae bacterium]